MGIVEIVIGILVMAAQAYPKIAPAIKDIFDSMKKDAPSDITQEEFEARIDAAIAKLPIWE